MRKIDFKHWCKLLNCSVTFDDYNYYRIDLVLPFHETFHVHEGEFRMIILCLHIWQVALSSLLLVFYFYDKSNEGVSLFSKVRSPSYCFIYMEIVSEKYQVLFLKFCWCRILTVMVLWYCNLERKMIAFHRLFIIIHVFFQLF